MGKRFTATEKWGDRWYQPLTPDQKLGWLYLLDNCDGAGVIDLNRALADFQIGDTVEWDALVDVAGGRIQRLENGKLWMTGFIAFQYGKLSRDCRAHIPVFALLEKHSLLERVSKGYPKAIHSLKEKEKEQDKEQETEKEEGTGEKPKTKQIAAASVPVPEGFETPAVREAIGEWLAYKAKRGEAYRDAGYLGRKVAEFTDAGPSVFISAIHSSIGNNYAGLFMPKVVTNKSSDPRGTRAAAERYLHRGQDG